MNIVVSCLPYAIHLNTCNMHDVNNEYKYTRGRKKRVFETPNKEMNNVLSSSAPYFHVNPSNSQ
jgi:hypothetical protein